MKLIPELEALTGEVGARLGEMDAVDRALARLAEEEPGLRAQLEGDVGAERERLAAAAETGDEGAREDLAALRGRTAAIEARLAEVADARAGLGRRRRELVAAVQALRGPFSKARRAQATALLEAIDGRLAEYAAAMTPLVREAMMVEGLIGGGRIAALQVPRLTVHSDGLEAVSSPRLNHLVGVTAPGAVEPAPMPEALREVRDVGRRLAAL